MSSEQLKLVEIILRQAGVSLKTLSLTHYYGELNINSPTEHGWERIVRLARKMAEDAK